MGNNSVPKFIFRLSRFPVYRGSVLGRFYCIYKYAAVEESSLGLCPMNSVCVVLESIKTAIYALGMYKFSPYTQHFAPPLKTTLFTIKLHGNVRDLRLVNIIGLTIHYITLHLILC